MKTLKELIKRIKYHFAAIRRYRKHLESNERYKNEHREQISEKAKIYYEKNRERILERNRQYKAMHREELNKRRKDYNKKYYQQKKQESKN